MGKDNNADREFKELDFISYYFVLCIKKLQNLTITALIRYLSVKCNKTLPKSFYTFWVVAWLIFFIFICLFNAIPSIIIIPIVFYRFWEMIIVNLWLFLIYRKLGKKQQPYHYVRLLVSLIFQYLTVWIGYAIAYKNIFSLDNNSFCGIKEPDSFFTWLYFSMTTITTLGYGEIHPSQKSITALFSVTSETFIGVFYIVWFLGTIISKLEMEWED